MLVSPMCSGYDDMSNPTFEDLGPVVNEDGPTPYTLEFFRQHKLGSTYHSSDPFQLVEGCLHCFPNEPYPVVEVIIR